MALSEYQQKRMQHILDDRPEKVKVIKPMRKVSVKLAAKRAAAKEVRGEEDTDLQKWFKLIRKKLKGWCACGCGRRSEKNNDVKFRSSCCHIFPQRLFPSVALHPMNFVERAWEGGCHDNMDNQSMDKWVSFEDLNDIKEKFHILAPLLTHEERAQKFYTHLESLIYKN